MIEYFIGVACFLVGLAVGVAVTVYGFRLGFKASYEIREANNSEDEAKGLFKPNKDPAEFDLLDKETEE